MHSDFSLNNTGTTAVCCVLSFVSFLFGEMPLSRVLCSMYVYMYGHTYRKSMDQPGKVASPARGQLNRKKK